MKTFNYYVICEDIAHATFVDELLKMLSNHELKFHLDTNFYGKWRFRSKTKVLNNYVDVSARLIKDYGVNLLFVIVDFDNEEDFLSRHEELKKDLQNDVKDKVLILLPVRTIEFWLRYIQIRAENPALTKNEPLENKNSSEMKMVVYGRKKPGEELTEAAIRGIMKHFDANWLCSRSKSFNHFHTDLSKFLQL